MNLNILHTPDGTADALAAQTEAATHLQQVFSQCFSSYGYQMVQTPSFEYMDVFTSEHGGTLPSSMIKFFDPDGNILALRPDFTPAIARMAATKFQNSGLLKFGYTGRAFLNNEAYSNVKQKEFIQSGVELLGASSCDADAEIIALTIDALLASGLTEFQIEIGHAGFFKGIVAQAELDAEAAEKLRLMIHRKDFVNIDSFLSEHISDQNLRKILSMLPHLFGDITVLKRVPAENLNATAADALKNLEDIYETLCDYRMEKYISFDLGLVQSLDYYTGMIFKGFTHNVGFPICGGGRYDTLLSRFGQSMPATGVALWVDRILASLERGGVEFKAPVNHCLVVYQKAQRKTAVFAATALRKQGTRVELYYGEADPAAYAKSKGIGGIFKVLEHNKIESINFETGERKVTSLDDLT